MKANAYVRIEESPSSGYISIEDIVLESYINNKYEDVKESHKQFGFTDRMEVLEGFKLKYVLIEVEYDGRKRSISEEDVKESLSKQSLAIKVDESMFGGYYLPTDKLKLILSDQLKQRKELVAQGLYEKIA
ncbi:hypothetical protein [Oceanobacillus sp. FSL H7-0719]|uniref:hypothetical protein n=1 Tax=Oceanobacillus sp. FSL H7-0719 TaxID=2954507 RepID=UPI003254D54F